MAPPAPAGISSGEISVSRMSCRIVGRLLADVARGGDEADQVLDQRLGDRAVGIVVRHVIADAIGAPAQPQLGQIAGADHHAAMLVGQAEQVVGAQARLHVLEGDVVDLLALGEGMADVGQHLPGRRLDVDLGRRDAQRLHQPPGVLVRLVRGAEARQRVGEHVLARQPELVHRPAGDDQRLGRIEAARDADDRLARCGSTAGAAPGPGSGCCRPRSNCRAAWPDPTAHRGSARSARSSATLAARRLEREVDLAEAPDLVALHLRAIGEAVVAQPLLADAAEIDVGA